MPPRAIAPMQRGDVPEVAALFHRVFRDGRAPSPEFLAYFEESFFGSPLYSEAEGGLVHRDADGAIDSALLVIPMQVRVNGEALTGRLMSNYMTDPARRTRGGADMVLTIRARNQAFCFSDSANPLSADHWKAVGGHVLPIQSLDFRHILRPAAWLAHRAASKLPPFLARLASLLAKPIDAMLRRLMPSLVPPEGQGTPISRADFIAMAPSLVERFAVHPVWSAPELGWMLDMAARNTITGPLTLRGIRDDQGELTGCSVFYARPGGMAHVLNILAVPGQEGAVIADLIAHADALGCLGMEGMAQPFLMEALCRRKGMAFVPRGFYCISTRNPAIVDAARRGDVYLGGLLGEDWSRLVTDFHD